MVLRIVMDHIESTGTEIDKAASGRRLRNRYFSETLQRPVNLNALVGQILPGQDDILLWSHSCIDSEIEHGPVAAP